jgi:anthranilate synthase/aminodeoxychorismate synthase-like glutamine amidotransferase
LDVLTRKDTMKKLLLIDCLDSFTDILAQSLENTGLCKVDVRLYNHVSICEFGLYDAFILSPGPGSAYDYPQIFQFLAHLTSRPVLGVCLGHQIMGLACGAGLRHLGSVAHGQVQTLHIVNDSSLLKAVPNKTQIGLYYSWELIHLPQQMQLVAENSAHSPMIIQHRNYPWTGVQFHPESYMTVEGAILLKNWLKSF